MQGSFTCSCDSDQALDAIAGLLESERAREIDRGDASLEFLGPRLSDLADVSTIWRPILGPVHRGTVRVAGDQGRFTLQLRALFWTVVVVLGAFPVAFALCGPAPNSITPLLLAAWLIVCGGWFWIIHLRFKHGLAWTCRLPNKR